MTAKKSILARSKGCAKSIIINIVAKTKRQAKNTTKSPITAITSAIIGFMGRFPYQFQNQIRIFVQPKVAKKNAKHWVIVLYTIVEFSFPGLIQTTLKQ
ncbi:hypothetical protein EEL32_09680 [Brevibacillus laterosporus]|nr:hypothetical protein EEL32_09680 [Brevibacillus laterosporus]